MLAVLRPASKHKGLGLNGEIDGVSMLTKRSHPTIATTLQPSARLASDVWRCVCGRGGTQ